MPPSVVLENLKQSRMFQLFKEFSNILDLSGMFWKIIYVVKNYKRSILQYNDRPTFQNGIYPRRLIIRLTISKFLIILQYLTIVHQHESAIVIFSTLKAEQKILVKFLKNRGVYDLCLR